MAKEKAVVETATSVKTRVNITSDHTDEEVLALNEKGATLVFAYEDSFKALSDEVVAELSRENARQYHVAFGAHKAWKKQADGARPTSGLEIVDPLKSKPGNKLRILQRKANGDLVDVGDTGWLDAKGAHWHGCWKRPDEEGEVRELGYKLVTADSDPDIVTHGATSVSSSRVIVSKAGKDDLVLFKIPMQVYLQHMHAVAAESSKRSGETGKVLREQLRAAKEDMNAVGATAGVAIEDTGSETEAVIDRRGEHIRE